MNSEKLEELRIAGNLRIPNVFLDSVKEVGLFVVVWSKDHIVDNSLEYLWLLAEILAWGWETH